ncbi:substrate-binding domain-containing protein [Vibrio astriarenae]|uniref:Substrate-binding domain-containing protein n=1 Tax=Vibrio astriarenae TaxID=1481923 RepID=A0A7Z2T6Z9_9VIBR|nr:LacI family DNA-binding transcriptional regulator [Vibrio astriarenae]QIA65487.1 substrate-binding domain-containing protein [Vibrio astriarenae]
MVNKKTKKPTLEYIANIAGVSITTVSRVINGSSLVREEVAKDIKRIISETGYVHKASKIELPLSMTEVDFFCLEHLYTESSFYAEIIQSIKKEFESKKIAINIQLYNKHTTSSLLSSLISNSQAILVLGEPEDNLTQLLYDTRLPVLLINAIDSQMKIPSIHPDYELGGYMAASYLIENGHTKVKVITSNDRHSTCQRTDGFLRALLFSNIDHDKDDVVVDLNTYEKSDHTNFGAQELLPKLIAQGLFEDVTAVFCVSDKIAYTLINALNSHNIRVPDDISVIGFDNLTLSSIIQPALTTLSVDYSSLAKATLIKLVRLSNEPGNIRNRATIPVEVIERETVKYITPM